MNNNELEDAYTFLIKQIQEEIDKEIIESILGITVKNKEEKESIQFIKHKETK